MRLLRSVVCLIVLGILPACSMHPLPDDLSRETTSSITNKIRCEVKDQVRLRLRQLLDRSANERVRSIDPDEIFDRSNMAALRDYAPRIFGKVVKYRAIVIGYSFRFEITERNNNSADFFFELPLTNTTFTMGASAEKNLARAATREFSINDKFEDLPLLVCQDLADRRANPAYPIIGSIGVGQVIDAYLSLGQAGATSGTFKDDIRFSTTIGAGITPKVEINAVPNRFRLTQASGDFSAGRVDVHELTITIPFPTLDDRRGFVPTPLEIKTAQADAIETIAEENCIRRGRELETQALAPSTGAPVVVLARPSPEVYCRRVRGAPEAAESRSVKTLRRRQGLAPH